MDPPRIFVTRRIPEAGLERLRRAPARLVVGQDDDEAPLAREVLLEQAARAAVLLPLLTERIDREVLEAGGRLRGVANYAVGFDNIDVAAATELGIPVSNTPGGLTDTTADLAWALLLAVARRIPEAHQYTAAGRFRVWGPNLFLGADVSPGGSGRRKVLGILGFGRIGEAVARRARGFDMEVLAHSPGAEARIQAHPDAGWASFEALLERSDFLSLHLPLKPATRHLLGEPEFRRMKPTAYLINTSRGAVVREDALVRALREGWIAGAGLDVYENEPRVHEGLLSLGNVVLAPHIGSGSQETRDRMAVIAATNALHHLRGEPAPQVVNPAVYESDAWARRIGAPGE